MPRKPKDIYTRIAEKEAKISETKKKLECYEEELNALHKERESLEMKEIFKTAKENNISLNEVIKMISDAHKK